MFGNPPAIDRVTCQPGLTANGEPTSNIALTIPYLQISADDNYGIITIIYGNLDPSEGTGGDPFTEFELPPGYAYLVDGNGAFVRDGDGRYIIVYAELPEAPTGYAYLINAAGAYLINADGAYILTEMWWDPTSKIDIDLVHNRAWTAADGLVSINTLLGADANTENAWGATSYDAELLTADGYYSPDYGHAVAFIGAARDFVLGSATIVGKFKQLDVGTSTQSLALVSTDGNDALQIDVDDGGSLVGRISSYSGGLNVHVDNIINNSIGAINVIAFTLDGTRAELAVNGSSVVTGVIDDSDRPSSNPFVAALFDPAKRAVQSITIYDALPSTAGLSELSETGVENTAPTDIRIDVVGTGLTSFGWVQVDNHTVTAPLSQFADIPPNSYFAVYASDPEGNPTLLTIIDNADGFLVGEVLNNLSIDYTHSPSAGTYTFTLRATDPGGLYVEQQFTITVTP